MVLTAWAGLYFMFRDMMKNFHKIVHDSNIKNFETVSMLLDAVMAKTGVEYADFRLRKEALQTPVPEQVEEAPPLPRAQNPLNTTKSDFDDPFTS